MSGNLPDSASTLYLGSPRLLEKIDADVRVQNDADYLPAYDRLVRAFHSGEVLVVTASDRKVGTWLRRLQERYGTERLRVEELTYRRHLQDLWGIQVPDGIHDEQIADAGLLDIAITPQPGRQFEDFILEIFYSPFLAQPRLPLDRLGRLLESCGTQQWEEASRLPVVGEILRQRLQQWEEAATSPGERLIVQWLRRSPAGLSRELATLRALAGYPPQVGQRVMGDRFEPLSALDLDLQAVRVDETQVELALDQIRVHLEQLIGSVSAQDALETILDQASGCLEVEFDAVQRLLRSGQVAVDAALVRRVRGVFAPIQYRPHLDQALADLDLVISREPPSSPNPDPDHPWNDDQWIAWAIHDYLPYRFWLEETGKLTGEIAQYASAYADWLYGRYPAMRMSSHHMVYRALPALKAQMANGGPILVVVIDNFNYKFYRDLARYMQGEGYYCEEPSFYLSMLPSCTEISKKCLFTGQPEPFSGTGYEKIVQDTWEHELNGRQVCYLPHIGALRAVKQREHDVYFLNYLPLDLAFHQDEEQVGISHAQSARSYLQAVARDVRAFGERIGAGRDLAVIVLSDHGSTRIPEDAPNLIDPAFFAKRVQDKHHRYASISDAELAQLPDNIEHQCYTFERGRFGLDQNYLAAKRHYRFKPTTGSTYIHGGLTPEETLVPVAVFKPVRVSPKPLTVRLLEKEFRYARRSEIRLELVNANAYPCENMRVGIQTPSVDASGLDIGTLAPMSQRQIALEARFRRSQGVLDTFTIRLTYGFLGEPHQQDVEFEIMMARMMTQAFDLTEL